MKIASSNTLQSVKDHYKVWANNYIQGFLRLSKSRSGSWGESYYYNCEYYGNENTPLQGLQPVRAIVNTYPYIILPVPERYRGKYYVLAFTNSFYLEGPYAEGLEYISPTSIRLNSGGYTYISAITTDSNVTYPSAAMFSAQKYDSYDSTYYTTCIISPSDIVTFISKNGDIHTQYIFIPFTIFFG